MGRSTDHPTAPSSPKNGTRWVDASHVLQLCALLLLIEVLHVAYSRRSRMLLRVGGADRRVAVRAVRALARTYRPLPLHVVCSDHCALQPAGDVAHSSTSGEALHTSGCGWLLRGSARAPPLVPFEARCHGPACQCALSPGYQTLQATVGFATSYAIGEAMVATAVVTTFLVRLARYVYHSCYPWRAATGLHDGAHSRPDARLCSDCGVCDQRPAMRSAKRRWPPFCGSTRSLRIWPRPLVQQSWLPLRRDYRSVSPR